MQPHQVAELAFKVNATAIPLSLAAVYAVLGEKFLRPVVNRVDTVTAKFRGDISTIIADAVRGFVLPGQQEVAHIDLVDRSGNPLESAAISNVSSLDSEDFKNVIRECIDAQSTLFDRYWLAASLRRRIRKLVRFIRFALCSWPVLSLLGCVYFGIIKYKLIDSPKISWLYALSGLSFLPLIAFLCTLLPIAIFIARIDRLET